MANLITAVLIPLLSFPIAAQQEPAGGMTVESGWLSQYDPDLMWATALQQERWGKIDNLWRYGGFIATAECQVGREGYLSINDSDWIFVVAVDCSGHESTTKWMEENNIIAEISFSLAAEHNVIGQGGVRGELAWLN